MTKWERFGDDTWINVDHVEVVRVEAQEDGRWQLTAAFSSGRSYPIGSHEDRELLTECTDALLRGQVGERLGELAGAADETAAEPVPVDQGAVAGSRWWSRRTRRGVRVSPTRSGAAG